MKNAYLGMILPIIFVFLFSCSKNDDEPDIILPNNIINVKATPYNGAVRIDWIFTNNPSDSVSISYVDEKNNKLNFNFLVQDNYAIIKGLSNQNYVFSVKTFNHEKDSSNAQIVNTTALTPTYVLADSTISVTSGLFGAILKWNNNFSIPTQLKISYKDSTGKDTSIIDTARGMRTLNIPKLKAGKNSLDFSVSDLYSAGKSSNRKIALDVLGEVDLLHYSGPNYSVSVNTSSSLSYHSDRFLTDNNVNTYWQSDSTTNIDKKTPLYPYPHTINVLFSADAKAVVNKIVLQPRIDAEDGFTEFEIIYKTDISSTSITYGKFQLIQNHLPQTFNINLPKAVRSIQIKALNGSSYYTTLAEMQVYGYATMNN